MNKSLLLADNLERLFIRVYLLMAAKYIVCSRQSVKSISIIGCNLLKIYPIMLALCLMLSMTYYAKSYAGIIGWSLLITQPSFDLQNLILMENLYANATIASTFL